MTSTSVQNGTTADCDTANYPIDEDWSAVFYTVSDDGDFVSGTNSYGDLQKANYFDFSTTAYTHLTKALFVFAYANSTIPANLSKNVLFKIYDDDNGAPGNLLATESRPLSDIKNFIDDFYEVTFSTAVPLPTSKKIYVSVDLSNFSYPDDSIAVYSTVDGEVSVNQAWEQWGDESWNSFADAWPLDVALFIFPIVSTSSTGCATLPVKLLSFTAQRNNKDVTLNWQIAEEYNMKGYEVQRADNNGVFKTVQTVSAFNNGKNQSYTITDKNAFSASATVQYRLKQIDGDGSVKYSRIVAVKANAIVSDVTFTNPFNGALRLQLNLATSQKLSIQVFDMQGKPVVNQLNKTYNASTNSIVLDGTAALKPGMYMLKINAGTEQLQYKIIKQ